MGKQYHNQFYGCRETTTRPDQALVVPVQVTGVVLITASNPNGDVRRFPEWIRSFISALLLFSLWANSIIINSMAAGKQPPDRTRLWLSRSRSPGWCLSRQATPMAMSGDFRNGFDPSLVLFS